MTALPSMETGGDGAHLLVVDDDDRIRGLLKEYLSGSGFRVSTAPDAAGARKLMQTLAFDLAVFDVMMPGEDGVSLARWTRARGATPILMLTAKGQTQDRIAGLQAGADDYLPKPFEPEELVLRIAAILRRTRAQPGARAKVSLGPLSFDVERSELSDGDGLIRLTEGEAKLLKRLAQSRDMAIDRWVLAQETGDPHLANEASARAVDVQVTRLRRKLEADPKAPRYLLTVRGVGYMLAPD